MPSQLTITDIPTPLPPREEVPELQPQAAEPERRITSRAEISIQPLTEPDLSAPSVNPAPRFDRMRRVEAPVLPSDLSQPSLERSPTRLDEPVLSVRLIDVPLSTQPSETDPQPQSTMPSDVSLSRRAAPAELSPVPELPSELAPQVSVGGASLEMARKEPREEPKLVPSSAPPRLGTDSPLARQSSTVPPLTAKRKVELPERAKEPKEEKPDPLRRMEEQLAEMQKELNRQLEAIRRFDEKLIEDLTKGQGPAAQARAWDAIYRLHKRQTDFSSKPIAPDLREREVELQRQAEQLIDDSGQDSVLNRGWHLLGRGKEETIAPQLQTRQLHAAKMAQQAKMMEQFRERYMRLKEERDRQGIQSDRVIRLKPITEKAAGAR
jgi:hypothetical protein